MTGKLKACFSGSLNPYENLALEECLLNHVEKGVLILYLWRNRQTVVIGRNQDAGRECNILALDGDGGFLARRLSGGGAVYHDAGNINFTFIARNEDFDIAKQTGIILGAVRDLGIQAAASGRNDLLADGRKFSGHAFYRTPSASLHHGTILVDTDVDRMKRYLNVAEDKLKTKDVQSVRSRVVNLRELDPEINSDIVRDRLTVSAEREYGLKAEYLFPAQLYGSEGRAGVIDLRELNALKMKFSSESWIYGRSFRFSDRLEHRFEWGGVDIRLQAEGGVVRKAAVYSDSMEELLIGRIQEALAGAEIRKETLEARFAGIPAEHGKQTEIKEDILRLICQSDLI